MLKSATLSSIFTTTVLKRTTVNQRRVDKKLSQDRPDSPKTKLHLLACRKMMKKVQKFIIR